MDTMALPSCTSANGRNTCTAAEALQTQHCVAYDDQHQKIMGNRQLDDASVMPAAPGETA